MHNYIYKHEYTNTWADNWGQDSHQYIMYFDPNL